MKKVYMPRHIFIVFLPLMIAAESVDIFDPVTAPLYEEMERVRDNEQIRINIELKAQYDTNELYLNTLSKSKAERRTYVIQTLKEYTQDKQSDLLTELQSFSKDQSVQNIKSLWIANVISCSATPAVIERLAKRDDITEIDFDEPRQLISTKPQSNAYIQSTTNRDSRDITWNVTLVNADDVWDLGFTGDGALVSVIDTGINYNHQDLDDHMWNGGLFYPFHGYDFNNNDNDPMDDHGHGTHCAGTVAGDGTAGSQTGVAPNATIMACKVLDYNGTGFESDTWDAIEFSVENNADIISMSLGWMHAWNPNRSVWRTTYDNALSAGVIASVAAANSGNDTWSYPIPDNVATPGDCPPPWLHPDQTITGGVSAVVCVGATNSNDVIAGFSSRGPVTWESISGFYDYPYNPEIGLIRPDVTAPGVNITSLSHYSNTGYQYGWDGTSMATPCVAGVMALMVSKEPTITPEQMSQILEETAIHLGSSGKNNLYGSGRVNAFDAVNAVELAPEETPTTHISGWNIVGMPMVVDDPLVTMLYPSSIINTCYGYSAQGYFLTSELNMGLGYWLRFPESGEISIWGAPEDELALSLVEGWNLISGTHIETNVNTISDPDNIVVPNTIYGFSATGYYNSDVLVPGQGYWVRSTANGVITVISGSTVQTTSISQKYEILSNRLIVNGSPLYFGFELTDTEKLSYSLPPKPPAGAFDVRFAGDTKYSVSHGTIEVMNPGDDLTIEYHILPNETWKLAGDDIGEEIILSGDGVLELSSGLGQMRLERVSVLPSDFVLHQNYPNPFNPTTIISFSLPQSDNVLHSVSLDVYDLQGRLVQTLASGSMQSGYHQVKWNGTDLRGQSVASGMYLYQLNTGNTIQTKKLLLLK